MPRSKGDSRRPTCAANTCPSCRCQPDRSWDPAQPSPELRPDVLSETWEPKELRKALSPLTAAYGAWATAREREIADLPNADDKKAGRDATAKAQAALNRIQAGIELLVNDTDARLAFCFANQAIAMQSRWTKGGLVNPWFPFQLAFQLLNLSAVANGTTATAACVICSGFPRAAARPKPISGSRRSRWPIGGFEAAEPATG